MMLSEVELKEWAKRKGYGKYLNNVELLRILYAKDECKMKVTKTGDRDVIPIAKIPKKAGAYVSVRGMVAQIDEFSYKGCPQCFRKQCYDHNLEPEDIVLQKFLVGDDTGLVWCLTRKGRYDFAEKDEVIVRGKTRVYKDNLELSVIGVEVARSG